MTITSPSGQKYNWEGPNPPTEEDINALKKYEADKGIVAPPASMALRPDQVQSQQANAAQQDQTKMQQVSNAGIPFGVAMGAGPIAGENQQVAQRARGTVLDSGMEAGGATVGQIAGAGTGPFAPIAVPVLGAAGGMIGNMAGQGRRIMMGEQDKPNFGQLGAAGLTSAIPGLDQAKGLIWPVVKTGAYYGAGNVLGKAVETGINRYGQPEKAKSYTEFLPTKEQALTAFAGGFPGAVAQRFMGNASMSPRETLDSQAMQRARDAFNAGDIRTPPMELGKGNDIVSSIGQKAAVNQQASKFNELGAQKMARDALGLDGVHPFNPGTPATVDAAGKTVAGTPSTFDDLRAIAALPYEELAGLSRKASKDLELLRLQNQAVKDGYIAFREAKITRPDLERIINTQTLLEHGLEQEANNAGRADLIPKMAVAKKRIAQTYAVENATNKGTGKVDMQDLANQLDAGIPLTDNLRVLALYAKSFPRSSVAGAPAAGVSALGPMSAANMLSQETPMGAGMATAQMLGGPAARGYQLSNFAQRGYFNPSAGSQSAESIPSALIRFAAEQKARENRP